MSAIWIFYGVAAIAALVGFYLGWRTLKGIRQPAERGDVLLQWQEMSMPFWQQDKAEAFFLFVHMATLLLLAALMLVAVSDRQFAVVDVTFLPIILFPLAFVFFSIGIALSFPIAGRLVPEPWVTLTPQGIVRGQWTSAWSWFSHFEADGARNIVRIYSRRSPALTCYPWQLPNPDIYQQAVSILGRYLPGYPPLQTLPWHKTRAGFVALTLLCTVPFLLVALLLYMAVDPGYGYTFLWPWAL